MGYIRDALYYWDMKFQTFLWSIIVAILGFALAYMWGGIQGLALASLLALLEITLSFDNAVVNATVLKRMSPDWQTRFLIWGIPIAVFGARVILPIIIIAASAWVSPLIIATLALSDTKAYGALVVSAHDGINAFGGAFLLLVSLKYFFDKSKTLHWIQSLERHLAKWGRIEAIEIAIALVVVTVLSFFVEVDHRSTVLVAGMIGVTLFIFIEGFMSAFRVEAADAGKEGLALFLYLNVLDSAFSLDGVVGAFALSSDLIIIIVGLSIGAFFVRSLTIALVRARTLESLVYLEHGAHWAVFGLAVAMLVGLVVHIPQTVVGFIGVFFITLAYRSSRRRAIPTP